MEEKTTHRPWPLVGEENRSRQSSTPRPTRDMLYMFTTNKVMA